MLAEFWAFLSDADNQATLAWLGGGTVVVIGGLWKAFSYFRKGPPTKQDTPSVHATNSVVAHDVSNSPINIGSSITAAEPGRDGTEETTPECGGVASQD